MPDQPIPPRDQAGRENARLAEPPESAGQDVGAAPGKTRNGKPATPKPGARPKAKPKAVVREPAPEAPYAHVVLAADTGVDQVVDYLVPAELDAASQVGARVRVRWAGQLVDGVVIGRSAVSSFHDHFEWLQKVVSSVPAFPPDIAELAHTVAEKYAGTLVDVLRLAVPTRSPSAEKTDPESPDVKPMRRLDGAAWGPYGGGREFIRALERKNGDQLPRALWTCLPGTDWAPALATAMHAMASDVTYLPLPDLPPDQPETEPEQKQAETTGYAVSDEVRELEVDDPFAPDLEPGFDPDFDPDLYYLDPDVDVSPGPAPSATQGHATPTSHETEPEIEPIHEPGRGALAIVPDPRALARLDQALTEVAGPGHHVVLSEELSPARFYQNWLSVLRGEVRMVIGTRAAMFAPVPGLGLVAMWEDGDDRHAEPRAPYPHVREVLLLRAHQTGAGALIGGYACSAEGAQLVASRWAFPLTAFRSTVQAKAPQVHAVGEDVAEERDAGAIAAGLPNIAWRTARAALTAGPVLVQVPQTTDPLDETPPTLVCVRCQKNARCVHCHGPLAALSATTPAPTCLWCGRAANAWRCDGSRYDRPCDGDRFRPHAMGPQRTADQLSEAFPGLLVISSTPEAPVAEVAAKPALVVAAPGAEPVADGGYAAALLLDGGTLLSRRDFRAEAEALRRWLNAAALVRPAEEGGSVVLLADPGRASVHALERWDPVGHARRELSERGWRHLPPLARVAELIGSTRALTETLDLLRPPGGAEVLGPVPLDTTDGLHRVLIRVPRTLGAGLTSRLREGQAIRGARKGEEHVRVRIDPVGIG